jgi:hypothetical protein
VALFELNVRRLPWCCGCLDQLVHRCLTKALKNVGCTFTTNLFDDRNGEFGKLLLDCVVLGIRLSIAKAAQIALRNGSMEEAVGGLCPQEGSNGTCSSRVSEYGDVIWVSSKSCDVLANPAEGGDLRNEGSEVAIARAIGCYLTWSAMPKFPLVTSSSRAKKPSGPSLDIELSNRPRGFTSQRTCS